MKKIGLYIFLLFAFSHLNAQLYTKCFTPVTIDSSVKKIFGGFGVEILNVQFAGYHIGYLPQPSPIEDIGKFITHNVNLGIDSGIILTSGKLDPPYGLSKPAYVTSNFTKFSDGDVQLDSINEPYPTFDAAVIEFDFIPIGDSIRFEYVFASDEYNYNVCNFYNDVFAFFISGPGISGVKNIALVPGTNIPVGVNSINNGSAGNPMWNPANCISLDYAELFVDHNGETNFIFDGSTKVLTAEASTIPCETYHLKFAIADGNGSYQDGAVFLKANSFNSEPLKIIPNITYGGITDSLLYEGCGFAQLVFRRTYNIQQPKTYNLSISGTAQINIDYSGLTNQIFFAAGQMYDTLTIVPVFDNIPDDNETIIVSIGDTLCNGDYYETEATLKISEAHNLTAEIMPDSGVYCDTVSFAPYITGGFSPYSFNWNNGLSNDSILNFYSEGTQIITLQISDACGSTIEKNVSITFYELLFADYSHSPDSISILNPEVTFNDLSSSNIINWFWDFGTFSNYSNDENPVFTYEFPGNYIVTLIIENIHGCLDSISKEITVSYISELEFPNVFTPNGDGINDFFIPIKYKNIETCEFLVFNRWGKTVFKCANEPIVWNGGLFNNADNMLASGTYFYTATYKDYGGNHTKTGTITIIK